VMVAEAITSRCRAWRLGAQRFLQARPEPPVTVRTRCVPPDPGGRSGREAPRDHGQYVEVALVSAKWPRVRRSTRCSKPRCAACTSSTRGSIGPGSTSCFRTTSSDWGPSSARRPITCSSASAPACAGRRSPSGET
jgi:hypothetical protein